MRHGGGRLARQANYDRNPTTKVSRYEAQLADDTADAQRFGYTVPSGKKAQVGVMQVELLGQTASSSTTDANRTNARIIVTPSAGSGDVVVSATMSTRYFTGNSRVSEALSTPFYLVAGDAITANSFMTGPSGGAGRVYNHMAVVVTEFDA
jgi:hypothetical protein